MDRTRLAVPDHGLALDLPEACLDAFEGHDGTFRLRELLRERAHLPADTRIAPWPDACCVLRRAGEART